jgi:hypothetical protein
VVGALTVVAIAIPFLKGDSARNSLDKWNQNNSGTMTSNNGGWTTDGDKWVRDMANARSQMLVLGVTGGSLIVAGVVVSIVGSQLRSRAVERVPPVSLAPVPLPGGGALVLGGRF